MFFTPILYRRFIPILGLLLLFLSSCSNDAEVIPDALNLFKGEVDGTSFEVKTTEIGTAKSDDLFAVTGIINNDVQFSLYMRGATESTYTVTDTGVLIQTVDYIRDVAETLLEEIIAVEGNVDSIPVALLDSISNQFDEIFMDSTQVLAIDEAFMFYFIDGNIYYSSDGFVELTTIDSSLNRISGNFEIELKNLPGGRKNLVGTFEELQYSE